MTAPMTSPVAQVQDDLAHWQRRFFAIWTGQAVSLFGSSLVQFALVWWLTLTTGSAQVLATASLLGMLPQILLGPVAGTLVDRWNRRVVMIVADAVAALSTLVLVLLFAAGVAEFWHVYIAMFVRSLAAGFQQPAMAASTTLMVPEKHYARVSGANQALGGIMQIVAAPIGALLIAAATVDGVVNMQNVLMIDIATVFLGIVPLLLFRVPQPRRAESAAGKKTTVLRDFRDGLVFMRATPGMLAMLFLASLLNFLLTPAFSLLPLLVNKQFGLGADALAAINIASGVGVVLGGIILGIWGGFRKNQMFTVMLGVAGIGVGSLLVGLAPTTLFFMAVVGLLIASVMQSFTNGPISAIMRAIIPPDMQGRVFSLISSVAMGISPISLALVGPLVDLIGIQAFYVVAGVVCVLVAGYSLFLPSVMSLGRSVEKTAQEVPVTPAVGSASTATPNA